MFPMSFFNDLNTFIISFMIVNKGLFPSFIEVSSIDFTSMYIQRIAITLLNNNSIPNIVLELTMNVSIVNASNNEPI